MFGTYRTLLALMVVAQHIGGVPVIGAYAVFGFYVLSGYLMTLIMHSNYGYSTNGLFRYLTNRFLRIYPAYWISIAFSVMLIAWLGESYTSSYHHSIFLPETLTEWLKNLFLIFPDLSPPRLTPPSWALTVELFFYILIGLGLSKNLPLVRIWFICSVIYHFCVFVFGLGWDHRYFTIPAASLPFATGALICHERTRLTDWIGKLCGQNTDYLAIAVFCIFLLNWFVGLKLGISTGFSFYFSYVLCSLMVVALLDRRTLPFISKKFDNFLGDFSYPIYLFHFQVGLVVLVSLEYLGISIERPNELLFLVSIPVVLGFSWLFSIAVERPIELVRHRFKKS